MNTEQKYGRNTPPPKTTEQAAQNDAKPRLSTAEWQNQFLQGLLDNEGNQEYFFRILDMVRNFHDSPDPTVFMGKIFEEFVQRTNEDLNKFRYDFRDFVGHLTLLHELRVYYHCFDNDTDYTNESEENGVKA